MRRLVTFDLDEQGLDRLLDWDLAHPSHWIRILSVVNLRWHDRYMVLCDCSESEEVWLRLMIR
jgi:hypothetical protein